MSLRQKKYTVIAVMVGVPALLLLAVSAGLLDHAEAEVITAAALLAVAAGVVLGLRWIRCSHCGSWLERNDGQYCQHCGEKIDWDAKPGRTGDQS